MLDFDTTFAEAGTGGATDAAQQQQSAPTQQDVEQNPLQENLRLEPEAKTEATKRVSLSEQPELDAVNMVPSTSTDPGGIRRLEGQVANLQRALLAATAQQKTLQQQLAQSTEDLDASQALLVSYQLTAESLQQRLTQAESEAASVQAQQHWSQQAAVDRQTKLDLQHQLATAQEDKAAMSALRQPDIAALNLELQRAEEALQELKAELQSQSRAVQSLEAAAEVARADKKCLLEQLEEAQQAAAAAEQQQSSNAAATFAQEQLQEQLEQDRDTLMEEVLSAKSRAADQERIIQSLRVAADASAREMALLSNQLDATEQQFASQAQELLLQQREAQQLHAALKDQSMHLKKAQFKGSSNDQGLRGMQQRLQEAMQDKRAAELQVQSMQSRLQQAEESLSQVRCQSTKRSVYCIITVRLMKRSCKMTQTVCFSLSQMYQAVIAPKHNQHDAPCLPGSDI